MKAIHCIIALPVLFLLSCTPAKNLKETGEKVTAMVNKGNFEIRMTNAYPVRLQSVVLGSDYTLKIKNDSAFAYLPYYGVAYIAPMNPSDGGIKFAEPLRGYKISKDTKKNVWNITYQINTPQYQYSFYLQIFDNGSADIHVVSPQRESIHFGGELIL